MTKKEESAKAFGNRYKDVEVLRLRATDGPVVLNFWCVCIGLHVRNVVLARIGRYRVRVRQVPEIYCWTSSEVEPGADIAFTSSFFTLTPINNASRNIERSGQRQQDTLIYAVLTGLS